MNAVIYARYSSHGQTEQSIEGQLHVCHEYAERQGFTVVGEYIDRALTGRNDDRPDFQRMINDAKKHAFQAVIVYKLDRFARNRYDSANNRYKLKQCGVKVMSAMEQIGDNPESIILEAVLESFAEYYSVDLSQKITRGRRESATKGKFIGGIIPLGYKSIGGQLVIDEAKAPAIQYAFERYAAGIPKKDIIAELNARGYRNNNGKPFSNTAFLTAFKNEKYIGVLSQGGIDIENGCPALIDKATFDKVQARLAQNRRTGARNGAKVDYLLSGKIYCGYCGGCMFGVSGSGRNGQFYYYSCAGRKKERTCNKAHEKKAFLEWYAVEQTVQYVLTPDRIDTIAAAVVAQYDSEFNDSKIKELERRIAKLNRDIDKFTDALLDVPKGGRAAIYAKIEAADAQKTDMEIDLSKLKIANKIRYTKNEISAWLRQFCNGDAMDEAFQKRIIDTFINSIYLYDDRTVIFYNIRDGKQISYIDAMDAVNKNAADADLDSVLNGSDFKSFGGA